MQYVSREKEDSREKCNRQEQEQTWDNNNHRQLCNRAQEIAWCVEESMKSKTVT